MHLVVARTLPVVLFSVIIAGLAMPRAAAAQQTIDSVVASVDGHPITSHDIRVFKATSGSNLNNGASAPTAPPGLTNSTNSRAVLKALITQQMLQDEAQKFADRVNDGEMNRYIANLEQHAHITDAQLRDELRTQHVTYQEFRDNVRKQLEAMTMIDREVRQKIVISDAQIETYYKAHPKEFRVSQERYELAQILIAVAPGANPDQVAAAKKKADEVHRLLVKGGDFAFLASQYSDDDSKTKGGELGYFVPSNLLDPIQRGIMGLKPGQFSQVIRSKYGFHIIKVEAHDRPGEKPLAEVKSQIRNKLMTEAAKAQFETWVDKDLIKDHYVETMD
ncbi:MAG: peptidylprolyl isomerase [Candidatus Binataceae bacterium]